MFVLWFCLNWEIFTEKCLVYFSEQKQAVVHFLFFFRNVQMHRNKHENLNNGYLWVIAFQVNFFLHTLCSMFVIVKITRYFIIGRTVKIKGVCDAGFGG